MKRILFYFVVTWASWFCDAAVPEKFRIAEGNRVKIDDVPYYATINGNTFCGATIIDKHWLLTAAHCVVDDKSKPEGIVVRTGTDELYGRGDRHKVDKIVVHPRYRAWYILFDNDIALLKLKEPITFNKKQTSIPIATSTDIPEEDQVILISGFGTYDPYLKKGSIPVISKKKCKKIFTHLGFITTLTNNMFCAGNGIVGPCPGDSGGPGVINGKLYGIISKGENPSPGRASVFTRVHMYLDWITHTTNIIF